MSKQISPIKKKNPETTSPESECCTLRRYIEDDIDLLELEERNLREQRIPAGWEAEAVGLPW